MSLYVCPICGYTYDESKGIPEAGIAAGTRWDDLPDDWTCPICGAAKADFVKQDGEEPASRPAPAAVPAPSAAGTVEDSAPVQVGDMAQMTPLELSALCSNLARGCEKQYRSEEAALFTELAAYFKGASPITSDPSTTALVSLVEADLEATLPTARGVAEGAKDRGALRAITWNEKVTHIQKSLLTRYEKEGAAMLANTGVWVCTICGFIFIGDNPPELCPVCKVPGWKFSRIEGRAS